MRRLLRWDLRERTVYSGAIVYDCTYVAKGQIYQNAAFMLKEEFQGRKLFEIKVVKKFFRGRETCDAAKVGSISKRTLFSSRPQMQNVGKSSSEF